MYCRPQRWFALLLLLVGSWTAADAIDNHVVQQQLAQIQQQTDAFKQHFLNQQPPAELETALFWAEVKPRHLWQQQYALFLRLNRFRQRHGLPFVTANALEPRFKPTLALLYEQNERLLTEIRLLKRHFTINDKNATQATISQEAIYLIDLFRQLAQIHHDWDQLNQAPLGWSIVFVEAMRLNDDIDQLLVQLQIENKSIPPAKAAQVSSQHIFDSIVDLLSEIQRLQRLAAIERIDFLPIIEHSLADELMLTLFALAEMQTLKATLGLEHQVTPPSLADTSKRMADVKQLFGWMQRKLQLIHHW